MSKKTSQQRWETRPLGDLGTYINGKAFKPDQWDRVGLPIIRIQNLTNPSAEFNYFKGELETRYFVNDGDLLISWSATLGSFIWDRGPAALNQHIFKVDVNERVVDKEFLHFMIQNTLAEMGDHTHGSTMKHITKGKFEALRVPVPPLEEQRRIVGRIKEMMERVDEIRTLREEALKEAEEVFPSLVEEYITSGRGHKAPLGEVVSINSGLIDPKQSRFRDLLHVGAGNMVSGTGELIELQTAAEECLISGKHLFAPGMVLYSKIRPYLRKVALPEFAGMCSADVYPLVPDSEQLRSGYLYYVLFSRGFTEYAISVSNRAGMPKVNRDQLFAFELEVPALRHQDEVVEKLNEATRAVLAMKREAVLASTAERALPQSILRKAFAGEL